MNKPMTEQNNLQKVSLEDFRNRLVYLNKIKKGWLDGNQGDPIDPKLLKAVEQFFIELHEQKGAALPYLYPTLQGEVRAEWSLGTLEISVILRPGDVSLDILDISTGLILTLDLADWLKKGL